MAVLKPFRRPLGKDDQSLARASRWHRRCGTEKRGAPRRRVEPIGRAAGRCAAIARIGAERRPRRRRARASRRRWRRH
eukprot:6200689-Pleurochrysis_carterae.AAC.2